jgi:hypothetical protein
MTTDEQTAAKIADDHYAESSGRHERLTNAIVAALEQARRSVTESARGSIIDCTREVPCVRRVLGTLPVSNDGFVVGLGADVWAIGNVVSKSACKLDVYKWLGPWVDTCDCGWVWYSTEGDVAPADLYSTESAAKAAMEGGKA